MKDSNIHNLYVSKVQLKEGKVQLCIRHPFLAALALWLGSQVQLVEAQAEEEE